MKSKENLEQNQAIMTAIDHIRYRPSMYIDQLGDGSQSDDGMYKMLKGLLYNSTDELRMGFSMRIDINVIDAHTVSVRDYGRGIPHENMTTAVTENRECGNRMPKKSIGGVRLVVINAMSSHFEIGSYRDGVLRTIKFEQGILVSDIAEETDKEDGTYISFTPDEALFGSYRFYEEHIESTLYEHCCLNTWLTIMFNDKRMHSSEGLKDLLQTRTAVDENSIIHLKSDDIEVAFTYTNKCGEEYYSFVNGWKTQWGGTHVEALKKSVAQAISEFFPSKDIKRSDIFHGFVAAISIRIEEPIFVDAWRNELGSTTITSAPDSMTIMDFVASFVKKTLSEIFVSQKTK
jgi:topoisomerase-4 subunit B